MSNLMPWVDSRGYNQLPQRTEEGAYYTYGTPSSGRAQYAHPNMMTFLLRIEHLWGASDSRPIGIGNISVAGGAKMPDHAGHRGGLEVDIRLIRRDGKALPVTFRDAAYDREATAKLVQMMWQTGMVHTIYFNDLKVPRVRQRPKHDDHLHVEVSA